MSRRFFHLSERAEEALDAFRDRWAGKWPKNGPDWALLDAQKHEVMDVAFDQEFTRRLDGNRALQAERRDFLRSLTEGEPAARVVDPIGVPGDVAAIGATDAYGYESQHNERASNMGGGDE